MWFKVSAGIFHLFLSQIIKLKTDKSPPMVQNLNSKVYNVPQTRMINLLWLWYHYSSQSPSPLHSTTYYMYYNISNPGIVHFTSQGTVELPPLRIYTYRFFGQDYYYVVSLEASLHYPRKHMCTYTDNLIFWYLVPGIGSMKSGRIEYVAFFVVKEKCCHLALL